MEQMKKSDIEWSRNLFSRLADGGVWGLPACGLVFQRRGSDLVLISKLPHDPAMPLTEAELGEYQDYMFEETKSHFGAAGVRVIR